MEATPQALISQLLITHGDVMGILLCQWHDQLWAELLGASIHITSPKICHKGIIPTLKENGGVKEENNVAPYVAESCVRCAITYMCTLR